MGIFMGKAERAITDDVTRAHGGRTAQLERVHETGRYLPVDVRERVHVMIQDIFLNPKLPWRSTTRGKALDEIVRVAGGFPHAYGALMDYWPIAKSARMNDWTPPMHQPSEGWDDAVESDGMVGQWRKVTDQGHEFTITLREDGSLTEHHPDDPANPWSGAWVLEDRLLRVTIGDFEALLERNSDKHRGIVWSGPEINAGNPRATVSMWRP